MYVEIANLESAENKELDSLAVYEIDFSKKFIEEMKRRKEHGQAFE